MSFAIIVLNWNNEADTLECLQSLKKLDYPSYQVLVVDNGSTDGSQKKIQEKFPEHIHLQTGENLGYAGGNNVGLKKALNIGADFFLLLNNDTTVHPHLLTEIAHAAKENPNAGALGPKIYFYDDPATIWYAGGSIDSTTGRCFHIGYGEPWGHQEITKTDYVCGCALAIRREALEKVDFFDERFFLIWEEIDWCARLRKAGYDCLFVPKAKLWHKVSASFIEGNRGPMWQYFYHRNRLLYQKKHMPLLKRWKWLYWQELREWIRCINDQSLPTSTKNQARAALYGVRDHFFRRYGKGRGALFSRKSP